MINNLIIPSALGARLAFLAKKAHMPQDEYALEALETFLEDREDYLAALEVSLRIERGEEDVLSCEEVLRELGLDEDAIH